MKILLAIVHYWDPSGSGKHQSLRPNPAPRVEALEHQLMALRRLAHRQHLLHMADRAVYPCNEAYRNEITIRVITDGEHTVLDRLDPVYRQCFKEVVSSPDNGLMLGFEAQDYLASQMDQGYDLYGYLEDDLVISDPQFFQKLVWLQDTLSLEDLVLPQRVEFGLNPHPVDRFFIDGPLDASELTKLHLEQRPLLVLKAPGGDVVFETPKNPHSGCFFLSHQQLCHWRSQNHWLDRDISFISPLESAATLGISKAFKLLKPSFSHASWLELQHWGTSFHCLIPVPAVKQAADDD
tara:strand:+ start:24087 stop:24968 length:882 start_codon:yes stop_codon:yes gene_type:complete